VLRESFENPPSRLVRSVVLLLLRPMATYLGAAAPPNAFDSLRTIVDTYLAELPESSVRLPSELIRAGATLSVDELLLAISSHAQHVYFRDNDSEYEDDGEARTERVFGTKPEHGALYRHSALGTRPCAPPRFCVGDGDAARVCAQAREG